MQHLQRSRLDDEFGQRWVCEGHDPDLGQASENSCQPEWRFAGHFEKYETTLGRGLNNVAHQQSRKSDVLEYVAVDDEIGLSCGRGSG